MGCAGAVPGEALARGFSAGTRGRESVLVVEQLPERPFETVDVTGSTTRPAPKAATISPRPPTS